jgi:hypothetical protein
MRLLVYPLSNIIPPTLHIHFISYSIQLLASPCVQQCYIETSSSTQFFFPHIFYLNQHIYWGRGWSTKDSCFDSSRTQKEFSLVRCIQLKTKISPKNAIIDKTSTYASETWILTKRNRKQIKIFERECIEEF